ncbi:MAG TPA: SEC-C metal-binding domain-containing protein [Elusimicrobiales bacterium]|nr:SEC-C metal-binding domain-containing protein [Elusimicrobiales bacterium]
MWDFLKKIKKTGAGAAMERPSPEPPPAAKSSEKPVVPAAEPARPAPAVPPAGETAKPHDRKTDEELAEELNAMSPEVLSHAKTPQMRKMVLDLYRKMLVAGVNVKDEKEVKKWLQKHPEAAAGGEVHKVETVKRAAPKVGRNDPCVCGSGKKYKKCCGAGQP